MQRLSVSERRTQVLLRLLVSREPDKEAFPAKHGVIAIVAAPSVRHCAQMVAGAFTYRESNRIGYLSSREVMTISDARPTIIRESRLYDMVVELSDYRHRRMEWASQIGRVQAERCSS